jgi:hypothetical protein
VSVSRLGGLRGLLVVLTTMGCGILSNQDAGPARFIRYEIFEVACPGCPASAPVLARGADGTLTLRLDAQLGSASGHQIVLSLRECETATRMQLSGGEIERIPVRFVR